MRMGIPPSMMRDMDMDDMMMMQEMEMDRHMARREPRYRMDNNDDSEEEDGGGRKLGIIKKIKKLLPNSSTSECLTDNCIKLDYFILYILLHCQIIYFYKMYSLYILVDINN